MGMNKRLLTFRCSYWSARGFHQIFQKAIHINFEKDCKFDCEKKARHLLTRFNFLNPSMGGPNRLCKLSLCQLNCVRLRRTCFEKIRRKVIFVMGKSLLI